MNIQDSSFDNPEAAISIYEDSISSPVFPQVRQSPCDDCAVVYGLYTDIALCAKKYLSDLEVEFVKERWNCHQGGRCEGACLILSSKKRDSQIAALNELAALMEEEGALFD